MFVKNLAAHFFSLFLSPFFQDKGVRLDSVQKYSDGDFFTPLFWALYHNQEQQSIKTLLSSALELKTSISLTNQDVKWLDFGPGKVIDYCEQKKPQYLPLLRKYEVEWNKEQGKRNSIPFLINRLNN